MRRRNRVRRKEMEARRHHGGEDRSGGIRCDFSVNVNPLGMPECAKKALSKNWKIYEEYPDDECGLLREALGHRFGLGPERIVCGNGASDLIYRLCLSAGFRRVLLPVPAFIALKNRCSGRSENPATRFFSAIPPILRAD